MFPGQGAQFPGMGADLLKAGDKTFQEYLEAASDYASKDFSDLGASMSEEEFILSATVQPLVSAVTLGYWNKLKEADIQPDAVMGHSLGEITALGAVGVVSPIEAIEISALRGKLMDESAAKVGGGTMSAVLLAEKEEIQKEIEDLGLEETLFIVNENAPTQIVISGKEESIKIFSDSFTQKVRCKIQPVAVAGPWHTPFIEHGRAIFEEWVKDKELNDPNCIFIMNAWADVVSRADDVKKLITGQLVKPVYWRDSLLKAVELGIRDVAEVGPGKILTGTIRANKIKKSLNNVATLNSLEAIETFCSERIL